VKGDASCHTTNTKYRSGYDAIDWSEKAYWECPKCKLWNHPDVDHCGSSVCKPE